MGPGELFRVIAADGGSAVAIFVGRVLDSSLRYTATHFSSESVKIINARLEELAKRLAPAP